MPKFSWVNVTKIFWKAFCRIMEKSWNFLHIPRPKAHPKAQAWSCRGIGLLHARKSQQQLCTDNTVQIFSAPTKTKILHIWDSANATLLSITRKKSAKWIYGKELLWNYWGNLFSLSQSDTVKILHNIFKELTQLVPKLFTEYYSQEITFNEQSYA